MKLNWLRSFWISLLTVIILVAALWFGGRQWVALSVLEPAGQQTLPGLSAEVEVLFDARGIPRIYGRHDIDVLRALGWLHASERLFQMELMRRVARGELAELVGPAALAMDQLHRSFGFARRVEEDPPVLAPETRALIEAYVEGINARVQRGSLAPEFRLLRGEPAVWRVEDVLTIAYYQSFYVTSLVQRVSESWRELTALLGPDAADWLGTLEHWARPSVPSLRLADASNTWLVAPHRSASGAALHAADPHLDYDIAPGLWYAVGLHSAEGLNVLGVTAPGLPFIAMGHNGQIGWAFTVAPVDLFEIWHHRRDPDEPSRLLGAAGGETLLTRRERFRVRGAPADVEIDFHYSPRGRVLSLDDDHAVVMQWAGFELPIEDLLESGLAISRARDFETFRQAASNMGALSVNWSYSDRAGNIGYVQSSPIPRRRHSRFFSLLDAADSEAGWDGFHPPADRPWALNPEQGWLANANNHAAGGDWPYPIPGYYRHLRMRRISSLLEQQRDFDAADMRAFQLDRVSDRALSWKDWLADAAEASGRSGLAEEIRAWDGNMRTDSDLAGLFQRWWHFLPGALFADWPAEARLAMRSAMDDWAHAGDNAPGADRIDRSAAAIEALDQALRAGMWPLGSVQSLTIRHPLAQNPLLDRWLRLSRGPIPMGGDAGSLNVTYASFNAEQGALRARAGASMRFVLDWSDPDSFSLNLTMGQSGHPLSPHFDDFLPDFLAGRAWVVPWTREAVEAGEVQRLRLTP